MFKHIYIYIYRERERDTYVCIYVHIYIYIYIYIYTCVQPNTNCQTRRTRVQKTSESLLNQHLADQDPSGRISLGLACTARVQKFNLEKWAQPLGD